MTDWADEIASKYFYPTRFVAWGLEDRAEFAAALRKARADALEKAAEKLRTKRELIETTYSMDDEAVFQVQQFAVSSLLDVEFDLRALAP
jgi:hypothetical protein